MAEYGPQAPPHTRIAWLRNNDELDLEQLRPDEREAVMERFAPEPGMRIYGRGIRRRLAPMLDGDTAWQAMAWAALLSLGQVPVIRYGEEIGLGDCLELPERNAVRMPMHWHDRPGRVYRSATACVARASGRRRLRLPDSECRGATRDARLAAAACASCCSNAMPIPCCSRGHTLDPPSPALLMLRYGEAPHQALALINFGDNPVEVEVPLHGPLRMLVGHGTTMQDNRCPAGPRLRVAGRRGRLSAARAARVRRNHR